MKKLIPLALLLSALTLSAATVLTFVWDPNDPTEEVTGYFLYSSTNVTGPYSVLSATGTNVSCMVTMAPARAFFFVTASNMWGESMPSDTVHVAKPVTSVTNLKLRLAK